MDKKSFKELISVLNEHGRGLPGQRRGPYQMSLLCDTTSHSGMTGGHNGMLRVLVASQALAHLQMLGSGSPGPGPSDQRRDDRVAFLFPCFTSVPRIFECAQWWQPPQASLCGPDLRLFLHHIPKGDSRCLLSETPLREGRGLPCLLDISEPTWVATLV